MRYCVFLRAINVGRHNRIRMEDLRTLCVTAGLQGVTTYLQSGNLVCDFAEPADVLTVRIEADLVGAGLRNASAVVFTADELATLVERNPFARHEDGQFRRLATLFRDPLPGNAHAVLAEGAFELVDLGERVVLTASPAAGAMPDLSFAERKLKVPSTTRYWRVVEGLLALA